MPTYTYACVDCGPFDQRRPLAESALPATCPQCGGTAARTLTAPFVAGAGSGLKDSGGGSPGGCGSGHCGHVH